MLLDILTTININEENICKNIFVFIDMNLIFITIYQKSPTQKNKIALQRNYPCEYACVSAGVD